MKISYKKLICLALAATFMVLAPTSTVFGKKIPLITKEELKPIMGDADVAIIDVRKGRDWTSSEFKIKGKIREPIDKNFVEYKTRSHCQGR